MPLGQTRETLHTLFANDEGHGGVQIYVSQHGEVVFDEAAGWAAPNVAMTADSISLWMSSGKPLIATAVLQLFEAGACALNDSVASIIPEFAAHGKEGVTIKHLLTHTGGFRSADIHWKPAPWGQVIERVCAVRPEPRWVPGERAGYHVDGSWYILGEIIQRVTGQPLPDVLHERLFEPLGMHNTSLGITPERATAYGGRITQVVNTAVQPPVLFEGLNGQEGLSVIRPGGNMRGPTRELGLFYEMMLRGGKNVLQVETVELMQQRHRKGMYDQSFRHIIDWGLGLIINSNLYGSESVPYGYGRHAGRNAFGHSGRESSTGFADPEHDLVIVVVFNGMPGAAAHQQRMQSLLEGIYEDLGLA
jgi:CubicO group peptidase (beta-lactamase class C family)